MNFLQIKNDFDGLVKNLQKQIVYEVELYKKTDSTDFRLYLMSVPNYCEKSIDFVESFLKNIDQNVTNLQKRIDELKKIEYEFLKQVGIKEQQDGLRALEYENDMLEIEYSYKVRLYNILLNTFK
jgi:hypothetical protein